MAEAATVINGDFNREQRLYDDTTTLMAEMLDGSMRTTFEYAFDGRELYARDGSALEPIFKTAIKDAAEIANNNPNLVFELRRRWIEKGEYRDMLAMAAGELSNTMIVVSDFPPELADAQQDVGGYNVARKQTMLRVITKTQNGHLIMHSQSLDQSNREALEAIYESLGFQPEAGELLGQWMHLNLQPEEQSELVDKLTDVYDQSLAQQFGGSWNCGRFELERQNTYEFACGQSDLVDAFIGARQLNDLNELYNIAAAARHRYKFGNESTAFLVKYDDGASNYELRQEILWAGQLARAEGISFSGCGVTLSVSDELSGEDSLKQAGYGNKTSEETKYSFDKEMFCVVCQAPPPKNDKKKMCGPCGICKSCDTKLKSKIN